MKNRQINKRSTNVYFFTTNNKRFLEIITTLVNALNLEVNVKYTDQTPYTEICNVEVVW